MTDIVERLRDFDDMDEYHDVRRNAAIEIERLRAVLQEIHDDLEDCWAKRQAAAALEPKP